MTLRYLHPLIFAANSARGNVSLFSCLLVGMVAFFASTAQAVDIVNSNDGYIRNLSPDKNDDVSNFMDIRNNPFGSGDIRYGLDYFDLSSLSGTTITSAEFHFEDMGLASAGSSNTLAQDFETYSSVCSAGCTTPGTITWNTYQAETNAETLFETLGKHSLPAPNGPPVIAYFSTASAADIAVLQAIADGSGALRMVLKPTSIGGASLGDGELGGANSFLRINNSPPPPSVLELRINRYTGETRLRSTGGFAAILLDKYSMQTDSSAPENIWNPSTWNSLTVQTEPGWSETSSTQQLLAERNLTLSTSVTAGQEISLGNAYDISVGEKLVEFSYSVEGDSADVNGSVVFDGQGLRLRVAKSTGRVEIVNSETVSIDFVAYSISSPDSVLSTGGWDSLQNQTIPGWQESNPTTAALTELNLANSSVLGVNGSFNLGNAYVGGAGGNENLEFVFDLTTGPIFDGLVEYIVVGDMDGDGDVDTDDTPLIVQALVNRAAYDAIGHTTSAGFLVDADAFGDVNGDGRFDLGDLPAFSALLGGPASASARAVPEPSTILLAALGLLAFGCRNSRRRKT